MHAESDHAFTGLEAAIVLIAFVVVAAVFSYMVLGAGFITTQKAQETVHTGIRQASSTLDVVGNVYGTGTDASGITLVNFTVRLTPGGTSVDFSRIVMTYSNTTTLETLARAEGDYPREPAAGEWAVTAVSNDPGTHNTLLEPGELFQISVRPLNPIPAGDRFTIEIKPSIGAAFDITRSVPGGLNTVNLLY